MNPQSFILIGRSGSGKGTQVKLLLDKLKENDPSHDTLYVYTGDHFREMIKGDSFTQKEAEKIYDKGLLEPEFLTVNTWADVLVGSYKQGDHLVFDGTPRTLHEAGVLHSVFSFYHLGAPWVIYLDVSVEESVRRLLARKREDDTEASIRERMSWYERDVAPVLQFYKDNPKDYHFVTVNGERSVEEIHADIVKKVGLD